MKKSTCFFISFLLILMVVNGEGEKILVPKWTLGMRKEIRALGSTEKFIGLGLEDSFSLWDKGGGWRWSYPTQEKINNILFWENKILVGSPHYFYLFDYPGNLKLKHEINDSWIGFPGIMDISPDGIALGFMDGYLSFYDFTGKEKWKRKLDAYVLAVRIIDDTVVSISDKKIYLFDKKGNLKAKYSPSDENYIYSAFIGNSLIGVSLGNNVVVVYDLEGEKWRQEFPDKLGALFISDNYLAVGSRDNFLYLFDLSREKLKWKKKLSQAVKEVQISKNKLLATTLNDHVYLFHLYNGDLEGQFSLGKNEKISAFSSSSGDYLVGSTLGNLYCFSSREERDTPASLFVVITLLLIITLLGVMFLRAVK